MHGIRIRLGKGVTRALVLTIALIAAFSTISAFADDPPSPLDHAPPDHTRLRHVADRLAAHQLVTIVAFGSSSTEGIGASSPAATYPSRLLADLTADLPPRQRIIVLNQGKGGDDADDMARRLPAVIAQHPDLIIWQTGSNDPLRNVPLDRFVQETIAGVQAIRAAHIDVMLMGPQLCHALDGKATTSAYRHALRAIGIGMGVPVIHRYDLMQSWLATGVLTRAQMLSPDGLHMADGGYAKLADAVALEILRRTEPQHVAMDTASDQTARKLSLPATAPGRSDAF
jgi:lysophospholipase L1-like esterase